MTDVEEDALEFEARVLAVLIKIGVVVKTDNERNKWQLAGSSKILAITPEMERKTRVAC